MISIDTKKKDPIGPYKNCGTTIDQKTALTMLIMHDFVDKEIGKVVPYGVYDIAAYVCCVIVSIDRDTAQFSVNSTRSGWI